MHAIDHLAKHGSATFPSDQPSRFAAENGGSVAVATKPCRIHYRKLSREDDSFPADKLSERIAAALETHMPDGPKVRQKVEYRIVEAPAQPGQQRALNNFEIGNGYVFGTVCLFAPGDMQALLRLVGEQDQVGQEDLAKVLEAYEIAERAAPEGHEYLHGITYWLAIDDHMYQIQSASLQSGAMEQYLTWFLRDQTKVIEDKHSVTLQSVFDQAQLADDEPTFIQVGGIVPETIHEAAPKAEDGPAPAKVVEVEERERIGGEVLGWAKGKKILEELYGAFQAAELLKAVPDEALLEVSVNIGFRAKKRRLQRTFMKDLAAGLRNMPDGEITVRTKSGNAKGPDARLFQDMSIRHISATSSLLVLENVRDQMLEVHRRFLHDGKIQP